MEMAGKHLMILGAGPFQLPAIRKAVELGYRVTTVDYLPDNVGHRHSQQSVNCSTADVECVYQAARDLKIDGICTFSSDVAVPTVAAVAARLGLHGARLKVAQIMADKGRFRAFLEEAGLDHPRFVIARDYAQAAAGFSRLQAPVIFKPVDASGSRGMTVLHAWTEAEARRAFAHALQFSRSSVVCVEEFIDAVEVGGDAFLSQGRIAFLAITHKHLSGLVVTGHSLPSNLSPEDQERVRAALDQTCAALGYGDGPLNFDVMVSPQRVVILEMSPRNGGNGIPAVIERATGVDVEELALRIAAGDPLPPLASMAMQQGAGSCVFGSRRGGLFKSIADADELRRAVPEVFDFHLALWPGERVSPFEHNGNLIGYVLFDCRDAADYDRLTRAINAALAIAIEEGGAA